MSRHILQLWTAEDRAKAKRGIDAAAKGWWIELRAPTRSLMQNAYMWSCLSIISNKVDWDGQKLLDEEWKDLFSAVIHNQKIVRGIEGGIVCIGARTSKMTVTEMGEMITLIECFAAERGIDLPVPKKRSAGTEQTAGASA